MKQHILVVDDEPPIRELLESYFRKHGYEVTTASDAAEAISKADNIPLHLVILDVLLPDSDGLEILEKLKAAHPRLPIIIMTALPSHTFLSMNTGSALLGACLIRFSGSVMPCVASVI